MLSAMHQIVGEATAPDSLDKISDEIIEVSRRFGNVVRAYLLAFSKRHLARQLSELEGSRIVVAGQAELEAFAAPIYLVTKRRPSRNP